MPYTLAGGDAPPKPKYTLKPPEESKQESGGLFARLWSGAMGNEGTWAGKVGMGLADPAVGMMQLGSRAPVMQDAMPFMPEEMKKAAEPDTKAVDTAVQQREQRYGEARTKAGDKPTGGFFDDMWRMAGNIASPVNLAAGGATGVGMKAAGTVGGRLATSMLGSAAGGAMQPVTDVKPGGSIAGAKAIQAGEAALGGLVAGGAGEVGGKLVKALVGNSPTEVDRLVRSTYQRAVRPSHAGAQSMPRMDAAGRNVVKAVDDIIANKATLTLTDPIGNEIVGQRPKDVFQFAESIAQRKSAIWGEISDKTERAGDKGLRIDINPMVDKLKEIAAEVELANPHAADAILMDAERYAAKGTLTPKEAENLLKTFNRETSAYWKNPHGASADRAHVLVEGSKALRQTMDDALENFGEPGYQALRDRYSALKSVESDVAKAALRDQKNVPGGLVGELLNAGAATELLHGLIDPTKLPRAGGMMIARYWLKGLRSPNAAINRLFSIREAPEAGPFGSYLQGMTPRATGFASPSAGAAAIGAQPRKRPTPGALSVAPPASIR